MDESNESDLGDVHDILHRMKEQECTVYAQSPIEDELVGLWRKMLVEWMYYVVDYCHLQRQAVAAASFFFDVAVQKQLVATPDEHQLAAATALQLALKTHDSSIIKLEKLVKLGRGMFTEADVVAMEAKILESMDWHLHPPSTYCFLRQFERLLPPTVSDSTRSMIRKVTALACEVSLCDHKYLIYNPSEIAYSAMLMALEMISHDDLPIVQRQCFLVRMAMGAEMDCKSEAVMQAYDELKESMNTSAKLPLLVDSLARQSKESAKEARLMRSKAKASPTFDHSPRHVMVGPTSG